MRPRLRWFQLSLRTLLAGITLVAVAAAWWFDPFVVETRRSDGSLRTRFEVRRDWRGNVVAHGTLKWFCSDGKVFTRTCYGEQLGDDEFADVLTRDGDFDSLIWLITETITLSSGWDAESSNLSIELGAGQTIVEGAEDVTP